MTLRILLIEDNAINAELARDLLELGKHQVHVITSAASFRRELSAGVVADIVLMDILLPDASGVTLLHELRAATRFAHVPVVALTAQALTGDRTRFLEAGFDAVLIKPINTRSFVGEVERCATRSWGRDGQDSNR